MGEDLLYSRLSPWGKSYYIASFPGGKGYYGGKTAIQHRKILIYIIALLHVANVF
jgi:hypothetical protein